MIADKDLILNEIPLLESINYIQCTTLDDVVARLKELIESDKPQCVSYGYNLLSSGESGLIEFCFSSCSFISQGSISFL